MKEEFVSYEQSKMLKALGFDLECDRIYFRDIPSVNKCSKNDKWLLADWKVNDGDYNKRTRPQIAISAPSLSMAAKWLREVKGIHIILNVRFKGERILYTPYIASVTRGVACGIEPTDYESALSHGISKALTLLTEKQ